MRQLDGHRVVVTGAASGMGAALVRAFVREGAQVACFDVDDAAGQEVVSLANGDGPGSATYHHVDVSSRVDVRRGMSAAVSHLGGLDSLVHAAAIERGAPAEDLSDEDWDLVLDVNAKGTMLTNQEAFRHLRDNGGCILNFASDSGMDGQVGAAHYAASKGAVLAWTRTIAREWGKFGIRVNAIAPAIWTPMYSGFRERADPAALEAHDQAMARVIALGGRLGDPERDFAPVMVFLVGEGARFITGQTIAVNGGKTFVR